MRAPWLLSLLLVASAPPQEPVRTPSTARTVRGWTVHVTDRLQDADPDLAAEALELLDVKLHDVARMVPGPALAKLREVPIWLGLDDVHGRHPCACYHPSEDWLREHGYDPRKARSVDVASARNFLDWSRDQPSMVLHELAHAYHHRVLGHDHAGLRAAHARAVEGGSYDDVLHFDGERVRAYALNNPQEFFAEATEAWFGTNDFYPFVRAELREHDPETAALLAEVWGG